MTENATPEAATSLDAQGNLPRFNTAPQQAVPTSPVQVEQRCETCAHVATVAQVEPCGSCFRDAGLYANWAA
ncbi:hypothetical protein [Caldimonas tepidiphila]|uniref:hypothetical protein n=1 Tax=Caldimonas tepidiphila TaxID=2315841 RepID=UPI000E5ADDEC|nr:hypothetical protein [Caldimonas tepidiphila]